MADPKHDIIYIDVEDDITSIIGKVKAAKSDTVSLVPPKRIGVLQSAVNLRLLERTARLGKKKLSLVTNKSSLQALAGSAGIPVAKNLQAEPELTKPSASNDDSDDVIDGSQLPVGEHAAKLHPTKAEQEDARGDAMAAALAAGAAKSGLSSRVAAKSKKKPKVPDFNIFRKKLILIGLAVLLIIGFILWSIFVAPHATIKIAAKTNGESINTPVQLLSSQDTNAAKSTIRAAVESSSEEKTMEVKPTGRKDVGEKAGGTVVFENTTLQDVTLQAGATLESSGGLKFVTGEGVTIPRGSVNCPNIFNCSGSPGTASVSVVAAENGSKYNAATGQVSGGPSGVSGSFEGPTSGGVSKFIKVVTEADVQAAKQELVKQSSAAQRDALKAKFGTDIVVLTESFAVSYDKTSVSPAIGEDAENGATLKTTAKYQLYGVSRDEVGKFVEAYMQKQFKDEKVTDQRIYENGSKGATFQDITKANSGAKATLVVTAQIGPKIDEEKIKQASHNMRYGEVQQQVQSIKGVEQVDVKFFPFWLNTVPSDNKRITVEFSIKND